MSYELSFLPAALKEWRKLSPGIRGQFKKKLEERLLQPEVSADQLKGYQHVYKIKLKSAGYRLAYKVMHDRVIVLVLAIGKREREEVYKTLANRKVD